MTVGRRSLAALLVVLALGGVSASARAELPEVRRLFGCPLGAPPDAFRPPESWTEARLERLGIRMAHPAGWSVERTAGMLAVLRSPEERYHLSLRRGRLVPRGRLDSVRRVRERTRLGPSHAGPRCERRLVESLTEVAGWSRVGVGIYGRPFGWSRRTYAVFAAVPGGTLTAVLVVDWPAGGEGPNRERIRRLLGGIRPLRDRDGASAPAGSAGAEPAQTPPRRTRASRWRSEGRLRPRASIPSSR